MQGYPSNIFIDGSRVSDTNPLPVNITGVYPTSTDAFGRARVSGTFTLFDSFHRFQDNGKIGQFVSGEGSGSAHDANSGSVVMTVGGAAGDKVYRESTRVFAYQPGKSLLVLQTFCMGAGKAGLRQRIGYFDVANGMYAQLVGTVFSFVRRSSVSGAVLETVVPQSEFNVDVMDGSGPSGFVLDVTRAQIMFMDIEWLGVGSVRIGFVIEGKFCLCHIFHHANQPGTGLADTTLPYMTTACLPVRAEIENVGDTGSPSSFRVICTSVMSEGGYELRGRKRSVGHEVLDVPRNLPIKNTFYPVVSIRLKATRLGAIVIPTQFHLIGTVASDFKWKLVSGASVSGGGGWVSAGDDSCVEYTLDATSPVTDGVVLTSGYFTSTASSSQTVALESGSLNFQLERNTFTGVATTFTLAVAGKAANDKVLASMDWEEVT